MGQVFSLLLTLTTQKRLNMLYTRLLNLLSSAIIILSKRQVITDGESIQV